MTSAHVERGDGIAEAAGRPPSQNVESVNAFVSANCQTCRQTQLVLIFIKKCFSLIEKKVDKGLARLVKTRNLRFQSKLQDFGSVANSGVGFLNVFHKILGGGVCDVNKLLVWFYCIFIYKFVKNVTNEIMCGAIV